MIFSMISEAFSRTIKNYRTALILGLFLSIITFFVTKFSYDNIANTLLMKLTNQPQSLGSQQFFPILAVFISVYFVIAWFRKLLLDEPFSFANMSNLGSRYWKYLLTVLGLILVIFGPAVIFVIINIIAHKMLSMNLFMIVYILSAIILVFVMVFLMCILSLVLPARAVDDPITMDNLRKKTKGNRMIIIGSLLVFVVLLLLVLFLVGVFLGAIGLEIVPTLNIEKIIATVKNEPTFEAIRALLPGTGETIVNAILSTLIYLLNLSLIAVLYERFIQGKNQTEA